MSLSSAKRATVRVRALADSSCTSPSLAQLPFPCGQLLSNMLLRITPRLHIYFQAQIQYAPEQKTAGVPRLLRHTPPLVIAPSRSPRPARTLSQTPPFGVSTSYRRDLTFARRVSGSHEPRCYRCPDSTSQRETPFWRLDLSGHSSVK